MIDPNFDPLMQLTQAEIEIANLQQNFLELVQAYNQLNQRCLTQQREIKRLTVYQQTMQIELAKIKHKINLDD